MSKERLVATRTGFYKGSRVRAGEEFTYEHKEGVTPPSWAAPIGTKPTPAKPVNGDVRPPAARKAAESKTKAVEDLA